MQLAASGACAAERGPASADDNGQVWTCPPSFFVHVSFFLLTAIMRNLFKSHFISYILGDTYKYILIAIFITITCSSFQSHVDGEFA